MSTIEEKVVAITGASSGIGEAAAMLLAEYGFQHFCNHGNAPGMTPSHFRCWHLADIDAHDEHVCFWG